VRIKGKTPTLLVGEPFFVSFYKKGGATPSQENGVSPDCVRGLPIRKGKFSEGNIP